MIRSSLPWMIFLLLSIPAFGQIPAEPPGTAEAQALFALARGQVVQVPPSLNVDSNLPLILTMYGGGAPVQRAAHAATLSESAQEAGKAVRRLMEKVPGGTERFDASRLQLDIVTESRPLEAGNVADLPSKLRAGLDGLACRTEKGTVYLPPLALLRHWNAREVVPAAFIAQESAPLPAEFTAERIVTASFVEERAGGPALALYRGNVLVERTAADDMVQALFRGGIWLLGSQEENGRFATSWSPSGTGPLVSGESGDQLRVLQVLLELRRLSDEARFARAADRLLGSFTTPEVLRTVPDENMLYVESETDETTPGALLLGALCQGAMAQGQPTADRRMIMLGEFLTAVVSPEGRLFARLDEARRPNARFFVRGTPYAEALIALAGLQRISPSPERERAVNLLADMLIQPEEDMALRSDIRSVARTIEALAEYYRLTRSRKHAEVALQLAQDLINRQIKSSTTGFPDYAGGFPEAGLPPESLTTAAAASGLVAAYELRLLLRQPTDDLAAPIHAAAVFLMNMQYRTENSFLISRPDQALGAFRKNPQDLSVQLATVSAAVRALTGAATVAAETRPPEQPAARPD